MRKQWLHGLMICIMLGLLVATFAPAPVAAANRSGGTSVEQTTNQDDAGQDDQGNDDQNDDSQTQNQQGQGQNQDNQNQQGQPGQGQQQGMSQAGCFAGADQGSANFPTGCWTSLTAGGRHWYQFRYQGLSANRDDDDDNRSNSQPSTVDVRLKMETPGCISFWVMTQERLQNPDPDGDGIEEPVGAGTPIFSIDNRDDNNSDDSDDNSNDNDDNDDNGRQNNPDNNNDDNKNRDQSVLNWQGAANANITFYVIVRNNRDFSCSYSLSIEGAGVPVAGQQAQSNQGQQNQGQQGTQGNNNGSTNNGNGNDDNGNNNNGNNNDDGSDAQG